MSHDHPVDPYRDPAAPLHAMVRRFAVPAYRQLVVTNFAQLDDEYRWHVELDGITYILQRTEDIFVPGLAHHAIATADNPDAFEDEAADGAVIRLYKI